MRLFQVDAFTREKFLGNPAGILLDAEGLTDLEMQAIARELNNSESAFITKSKSPEYDIEVRFFTPTTEIPMCGHNTIALHYVRAVEGDAKPGIYRQKTKAGIISVEIVKREDDFEVTMTHNRPVFDPPIRNAELLKALGLEEEQIRKDCPIQVVSTGNRKVFVGIQERSVLNSLKPDLAALRNLAVTFNCTGYYVFAFDPSDPKILTHGRMFAPQIGIDEDPVTGMALGPLGAYLAHNRLAKETVEFIAQQGEGMGRKGQARVFVSPEKIQVSGAAVIVFKASI